ncbi:MAG: Gfo/Idh/MocA family oxidoreductase [Prevotellaceae bacterium]|jgi:predicted dehydrogenase|nr:Gfo/Idh/MocA family oxidoreductase [Prevotellaceae bacterium]
MSRKNTLNRRQFLTSAAVAGAAVTMGAGSTLLTSCSGGKAAKKQAIKRLKKWRIPTLTDMAIDGKAVKVGLVGCGGQGTGDIISLTQAANGIEIVALGDVFKDRVDGSRERIKKETGQEIAADKCFVGFDAYQKVIDSGVDLVLLVTPPIFRPLHFETAVKAGKHVFMEKPVSADVAGSLKILATAKMAESQGLSIVTGTQRRHQRSYVEAFKQIADGAIGEIVGGEVYWNQSMLWYRNREAGWSDMEWMIRDWVNWTWLSGDHIVEQHVHNIDVFNWFAGLNPVSATGFGARQRRLTGDQYDMFSVDFVYENGIHMHSMCRQIDGCTDNVSEVVQGIHGSWTSVGGSQIKDLAGNVIWKWDYDQEKQNFKQTNPYVLQFVDLITAIRSNKPVNEAADTANSSLIAVMGRESAYTGQTVSWEQIKGTNMNMLPENPVLGPMDMSKYIVPIPGKEKE